MVPALRSAEDVEPYRRQDDSFPITAQITHPGSLTELYYGVIKGPQIQLRTDTVLRGTAAGPYQGGSRILGLVNGQLFWRWDATAVTGGEEQPHASAILDRMPDRTQGRLPR